MNIEEIRRKILDPKLLPYTHQIINVKSFLKDVDNKCDIELIIL